MSTSFSSRSGAVSRWLDRDKALAYTSFRYGKADLFLRYISKASSARLADFEGLNYSVDWSEKRKEMLVTLSKDGNPEIYIMNKRGKIRRRLTHSRAMAKIFFPRSSALGPGPQQFRKMNQPCPDVIRTPVSMKMRLAFGALFQGKRENTSWS